MGFFDDNHPDNGPSQAQRDAFLAANPGDEHRLASAFADDNSDKGSTNLGAFGRGVGGGPQAYQGFTKTFDKPQMPGDIMDRWSGTFTGPQGPSDLMDKWDKTFKWDSSTALNDPAYKQRMDEETKAVQRSAAAGGTLMTPGVMQALQDRAAGVSAQFQNDDFSRAKQSYDSDYSTFMGDRSRRSDEAQRQFGNAKTTYDTNYNTFEGDRDRRLGAYNTQFGNERTAYMDEANIHDRNEMNRYNTQRTNRMDDQSILNDNRDFGLRADQQRFNQNFQTNDQRFNQGQQTAYLGLYGNQQAYNQNRQTGRDQVADLQWLGDRGYGASTNLGSWANQYGQDAADIYSDIGNAQAGGRVGAANAWQQGMDGVANDVGSSVQGTPYRIGRRGRNAGNRYGMPGGQIGIDTSGRGQIYT